MQWTYESLKEAVRGRQLPLVLVDLDRFDANVHRFTALARQHGKTIRFASKSLRVPALLRRAISLGGSVTRGVMCYSASEAMFLSESGFEDLLVAYPAVQDAEIAELLAATRAGKTITLVVDSLDQAERLANSRNKTEISAPVRVCIELDVSWRACGQHIGAQRSPLRDLPAFDRLLDQILHMPDLQLTGVMAYESQLAGVPDSSPFARGRNLAVRIMKRLSRPDVAQKRRALSERLKQRGLTGLFFNGGGSGSFAETVTEPWLTEVTVGSGLFQPHLFDYYDGAIGQPALCFALPVTRIPQSDRVTCQGGGFIASGAPGRDRAPIPIFPSGLRVDAQEGFGEVQTPLIVPVEWQGKIRVGDPIFFRPAKAGEIAERFTTCCLLASDRIVDEIPTYRGLGKCFH